jgi:hypothetical protein
MEMNGCHKESNSDYNKEGKYREEIFKLLEGVVNSKDDAENNLFRKLFKEDAINSVELIELIKKLK